MGADNDGRKIDGRKPIDAEAEVAGQAHHDQGQDEHGRKDRTADTDFGEFLQGGSKG